MIPPDSIAGRINQLNTFDEQRKAFEEKAKSDLIVDINQLLEEKRQVLAIYGIKSLIEQVADIYEDGQTSEVLLPKGSDFILNPRNLEGSLTPEIVTKIREAEKDLGSLKGFFSLLVSVDKSWQEVPYQGQFLLYPDECVAITTTEHRRTNFLLSSLFPTSDSLYYPPIVSIFGPASIITRQNRYSSRSAKFYESATIGNHNLVTSLSDKLALAFHDEKDKGPDDEMVVNRYYSKYGIKSNPVKIGTISHLDLLNSMNRIVNWDKYRDINIDEYYVIEKMESGEIKRT